MASRPASRAIADAPCAGGQPSLTYCASEDAWILQGFDVSAKMTGDPTEGLDI